MDHNASISSEISSEDFALMNVPASVFSILMNIFFIYCMAFQQHGQERLKQPLNVLQGTIVGCNITISVCTLLKVCVNAFPSLLDNLTVVVSHCAVYSMMTSVSSSFWRNVFYYCQITPAQSYFIWLKKNISVFIHCALLINGLVYLFGFSLTIAISVILQYYTSKDKSTGFTTNYLLTKVMDMWHLVFSMILGLLILNLCGMSASSCATVIYLWKHLKNMEESNTLTSPRSQRQIRMIIRSIAIHALLHLICSVGIIVDLDIRLYSRLNYDHNHNVLCTFVSFYALGTTITLGMAQSLFRQRVAYAWKKMFAF